MEQKQLYATERRQAILSLVEKHETVSVQELAEGFSVSRVTIRQDLDELDRMGKLKRTHGGAVALSRRVIPSIQERRRNLHGEAKQKLVQTALRLIEDDMSLYVDSGTTALELVRLLVPFHGLTIITPDLSISELIDEMLPDAACILLGGHVRKAHRYVTGPLTLDNLRTLHADAAFLCPGAYVSGKGFLTNHDAMCQLKRAALTIAKKRYILMDSSKIQGHGLMCFATLDEIDALITDADVDGQLERDLAQTNAELLVE